MENASFKWNEVGQLDDKDTRATTAFSPIGSPLLSPVVGSISIAIDQGSPSIHSLSSPQEQRFELRDIDIRFPEGELTVIVGPTASGKTALLVWDYCASPTVRADELSNSQMALLGEMTTLSGRIIMSKNPSNVDEHGLMHAISYAAQTPWLRHQSIKENILFDTPYDEERYNQVVECCALKPDLDIFEDGDKTEIGVRYMFFFSNFECSRDTDLLQGV